MVTPAPDLPTMELIASTTRSMRALAASDPLIHELGPVLDGLARAARTTIAAEPDPARAAGYILASAPHLVATILCKPTPGANAVAALCRAVALGLITGDQPTSILAGDPAEDPS